MTSIDRNKVTLADRLRSLIAGTEKHQPSGQLTLGGVAYTEATLVQTLRSLVDVLTKVDAARGGWKDALKEMRDLQAKVGPVARTYQTWLVTTYGNAPATLADYGIELKPRTPPDANTKALAAAKRVLTRKARGTVGAKKKALIKGPTPTLTITSGGPQVPEPVTTAPAPTQTGATPPAKPA